jgi:hypothetical protein
VNRDKNSLVIILPPANGNAPASFIYTLRGRLFSGLSPLRSLEVTFVSGQLNHPVVSLHAPLCWFTLECLLTVASNESGTIYSQVAAGASSGPSVVQMVDRLKVQLGLSLRLWFHLYLCTFDLIHAILWPICVCVSPSLCLGLHGIAWALQVIYARFVYKWDCLNVDAIANSCIKLQNIL